MFANFILADELFRNVLQSLQTWVLVNNNLRGNLCSSLVLPIAFDEIFKVTSVPCFIPDFNLSSFELDNFAFKVLCLMLSHLILKKDKITILSQPLVKNLKWFLLLLQK